MTSQNNDHVDRIRSVYETKDEGEIMKRFTKAVSWERY